jgi:hypothetical protein
MKKHFIVFYLISVQICFSQVSLIQKTNSFEIKTDREQRLFNLIKTDPTTITYNYIEINKRYLGSDNIVLEIDGDSHILKLDRIEQRSLGNYSVFYKFKDEFSTAFFTCLDDDILGFIQIKNKNYEIKTIAEGKYILRKFDQSKYGECGYVTDITNSKLDGVQSKNMITIGQTCNLRILILYTDAVSSNVNSPINLCQQSIDLLNQTFINSGVNYQAELAYAGETSYVESDDCQDDVMKMRNPGDGYMDDVHDLRDTYSADLCVLLSTSSTDGAYFGISPGIYCDEANMFVQVRYDSAVNNITFPHEIGHLLGCRHNNDATTTPFSYGHGYIQSNNEYRDIMAVNTYNVTRIPYWSNPNLTLYGLPFGTTSTAHNVRVLNETINDARSFRQAYENLIYTQSFISSSFIGTLVAENIETNGVVSNINNNNLSIQAGTSITLKNGFFTQNGSIFNAKIIPIDNCPGDPSAGGTDDGGELVFKLQKNNVNTFNIYPNPALNSICIEALSKESKISYIYIYNLNGVKCEISNSIKDTEPNISIINIEDFSKGMYILSFEINGEIFNEKFIKN